MNFLGCGFSCSPFAFFLGRLFFLFFVNFLDVNFDFFQVHHTHGLTTRHDRDLQIFTAQLNNFKQCLDRELNCVVLSYVLNVSCRKIFLQEFANSFCVSANSISFPFGINTSGIRLVQMRCAIIVKACEKTRNAIRTTSSILSIPLLHSSNMASNIFEADGIFNSETVGLAFLTSPFDDDSCISGKASKGHHNMVIENKIFCPVLSSCSLATAFFSTPRTTTSFPRTP